MRNAPTGCPFAPRCAWRLDVCWTDNPALAPVVPGTAVVTTGEHATHRIACHNPPTPRRRSTAIPGGRAARAAAAGQLDELASYAAIADGPITAEHLAAPADAGTHHAEEREQDHEHEHTHEHHDHHGDEA